MENNKYEELRQQIEDKKDQIDILKMDIQELEADIKSYIPKNFANILEKANTFLNKWYLFYDAYFNSFEFCYCTNVTETYNGIDIDYRFVEITTSYDCNIRYYKKSIITISSMKYFDKIAILNEEEVKEICNKINKIIRGEQTVEDLFGYLKELYNAHKKIL